MPFFDLSVWPNLGLANSLAPALASFILAIVCMAEKKIAHGLINLLAIVIGIPLLWVVGLLWW
jgi:hypothetical protein